MEGNFRFTRALNTFTQITLPICSFFFQCRRLILSQTFSLMSFFNATESSCSWVRVRRLCLFKRQTSSVLVASVTKHFQLICVSFFIPIWFQIIWSFYFTQSVMKGAVHTLVSLWLLEHSLSGAFGFSFTLSGIMLLVNYLQFVTLLLVHLTCHSFSGLLATLLKQCYSVTFCHYYSSLKKRKKWGKSPVTGNFRELVPYSNDKVEQSVQWMQLPDAHSVAAAFSWTIPSNATGFRMHALRCLHCFEMHSLFIRIVFKSQLINIWCQSRCPGSIINVSILPFLLLTCSI